MKPVFAVLNKQTLSLFENENVKGLLYSIPLTKVDASCWYLKWEDTYCWSVVGNDNTIKPTLENAVSPPEMVLPSQYSKDKPVLVTLCATMQSHRDSWANAINEFHYCEVKKIGVKESDNPDFMRTIKD